MGSYKDVNEDFRMDGRLSDVIIRERAINQTDALNIYNNTVPPCSYFTAGNTQIPIESLVQFSDQSQFEAINCAWTFEGGIPETSHDKNPLVKYNTKGAFNVSLHVCNDHGEDEFVKEWFINVGELGIDDDEKLKVLKINPNPVKENLSVLVNDPDYLNGSIKIFDLMGGLIYDGIIPSIDKTFNINLSKLNEGLCLIYIVNESGKIIGRKLVKE